MDSGKFKGLVQNLGLEPMEAPAMIATINQNLFIGIPKERLFQENRVALTPESVKVLINRGHRVLVETKAGVQANFFDTDYSEAGALIVDSLEEVYQADMIIKIAPPTGAEIDLLKPHHTLISPIHLPTLSKESLNKLIKKKVTCLAYEYIKSLTGEFPFVSSMSEIAGNSVILIAAEYLSNMNGGKGTMFGGISGVPPTKVVIIGAGVVGTNAARAALGLGAQVCVFDDNIHKLMALQNTIGQKVFTSVISPTILERELITADVAIGALHSREGRTPLLVSEEIISKMQAGSVLIDVSIDQGGCFETSEITNHSQSTFKKYGIIHYCVPNIPSRFAKTASYAFSHILTPILLNCHECGGIKHLLYDNEGVRHGVYIYKGQLTNMYISKKFDIPMKSLNLLFAADY